MSRSKAYQFEKEGRRATHRARNDAQAELRVFVRRLGIEDIDYADCEDALLQFVTACHLNILWYERRIKRERRQRNFFIILSLALLLLVPVGIFILGSPGILKNILKGLGMSIEGELKGLLPAQITAFLTSLFAILKSLNSWFIGRKTMAHFQAAATQLKALLYKLESLSVEDIVDPHTHQLKKTFLDRLEKETTQAREIEQAETQKFYDDLTLIDVDITDPLDKASEWADQFTKRILPSGTASSSAPGDTPPAPPTTNGKP